MKRLLLGVTVVMLGAGCAVNADDRSAGSGGDEVVAGDPLAMPQPMLDFLGSQRWGDHHLEWHTARQWDRLAPSDQAWAKGQGWVRADLQEGAKGNGLEFLAMHHVMIKILTTQFPEDATLFVGWARPPIDAKDPNDPCPSCEPFDANKRQALETLTNNLGSFPSDDELGLYIETAMRPTPQDPEARAVDKGAGVHNYLHNRFMDPNSKIDIGDPSVNLQNKRFWRLHGWIESRWTEFRRLKGLTDQDPAYKAAIQKGEDMLAMVGAKASSSMGAPPPNSLRKFFENQP